MITMQATVLSVQGGRLVVLDNTTRQRVIVNTKNAYRFRPGNLVCIRYNGIMTKSLPPQIHAQSIVQIPWFGPWKNLCMPPQPR